MIILKKLNRENMKTKFGGCQCLM